MFHERDTNHRRRDCPVFLESKKKMTQKHNQPLASSTAKEDNHTSHWHQPLYQNFSPRPEYQPNYHRYPLQYYHPYNYTPHTSQIHISQPTITYPPTPLQITYSTASSQTSQPKMEPNNPPPPPPPPPNQDSSQQATSFPTFGTIHTITEGSNLTYKNKRQKQEHYCQVNHVAVKGPIVRTKWLHIQITFTEVDIKVTSFPHTNAMVIIAHINKWNVTRVLVDNGS
jgi:hypothetical protein